MKKLLVIALATGLLASGVVAQDQPKGALSKDFVAVIGEFDSAMVKRFGVTAGKFVAHDGEVTRAEVIAAMDEALTRYQTKFRVTPRRGDVYPEIVDKFNSSAESRESLRRLSRWSLIGPVSSLVASDSTTISEDGLGDALGYFYAQVTTFCHQPDPAWTPALQGGE